jgi:hypothetical protein
MQSRPASTFTTPALVSDQLVKADTGASQAETDEYNDYYTLVQQYCFDMSKIIESQTRATFVPYYAAKDTYFADAVANHRLQWHYTGGFLVLTLDEDLLTVDTMTYMAEVLTASQYRLVDDDDSANGYPFRKVQFKVTGLPTLSTDFDDGLTIAGEWGTHDNASDAYSDVGVTAEALDASETSIDVADATLYNVYEYIRIDDELMLVTAIDTDATPDALTVTRGVNGFTKATHEDAAAITRWNVPHDVRLLATRMCAYWFGKRSDKGERIQVVDNALVIAQFSKEIAAIAERRQRNRYEVV